MIELTATERRVRDAFATGERVDLGDGEPHDAAEWGPERSVRAEVIAGLLMGTVESDGRRVPAVRLRGARIVGRLELAGARVPWMLSLRRCVLDGVPDFSHAEVRTIKMTNCLLPGCTAGWAKIDGHISLGRSTITGPVELTGARISGELRLGDARIRPGEVRAIEARALVVEGACYARRLHATGRIRLTGARLSGGLILVRAELVHPSGTALTVENAEIDDILDCSDGFRSSGRVRLRGAKIAGLVSFRDATLSGDDVALHATGLRADELDLRTRCPIEGLTLLQYAAIGTLSDHESTWPPALRLNGLVYESLRHASDADAVERRLDWLSRDPYGFRPQPYEQLAAYYRRIGRDDAARRVLYAKHHHRQKRHLADLLWARLLDWTVGYGYMPWRAGLWLAGLLALGTLVFGLYPPNPLKSGESPEFNPLLYTMDLMSPVGGFGQQSAFAPEGPQQWLAGVLIVAGWILATALIAGVSRVLKRQ